MNKRDKIITCIAIGVVALVLLVLILYNVYNNKAFFDASLTSCISIAVAIGVSYFLSQWQNDKRKQKDILLSLLSTIQGLVSERDAYIIKTTVDPTTLTMRNRDISNRIEILKAYGNRFGISAEVNFVIEKFAEYEDLIGSYIGDLDYLHKSEKLLKRPLDLINNKLFDMMLKIYS